ncbi:unnamed protein product, partial [Polarella glacialis]
DGAPKRHQADLALLAAAKGKASPPRKEPGTGAARKAPESDGEDSAEEAAEPSMVAPERFDRDMGLLYQKLRRKPTSAAKSSPGPEATDADEEIARRLQAVFSQGEGDESMARRLQEDFDTEPGQAVAPSAARPELLAAASEAGAVEREDADQ